MTDSLQPPEHELTHREFSDGQLGPACTCGWYSPRRSHVDFERHVRNGGEQWPMVVPPPSSGDSLPPPQNGRSEAAGDYLPADEEGRFWCDGQWHFDGEHDGCSYLAALFKDGLNETGHFYCNKCGQAWIQGTGAHDR